MIYLNNAATSFPRPKCVLDAVTRYLETIPGDTSRSSNLKSTNILSECRGRLAKFFNIEDKSRIVFTAGGTASLNFALKGLGLQDDHIITTTLEHNSVLRPLMELKKELNLRVSIIDNPLHLENEIKDNTKLIIINHCSNVTGQVYDIESIGKIAHKNGLLFMVDGSQSAGMLPIDIQKDHIDILAFTGHKSLYGLQGIGGLYIDKKITLKPLTWGGTGTESELMTQPMEVPQYYESGTPNIAGVISLNEGISFINEVGIDKIYSHKKKLIKLFISEMENVREVVIYNHSDQSPLCSFIIKGLESLEVGHILDESFNIITRTGLHCSPLAHKKIGTFPNGAIRISPSFFNTEDDILTLVDAITKIIESCLHGNSGIR